MSEEIHVNIHMLAKNIGSYFYDNEYCFIDEQEQDNLIDKIEQYLCKKNYRFILNCLNEILKDCKKDIMENIKYNDLLSLYCSDYNRIYKWKIAIENLKQLLK